MGYAEVVRYFPRATSLIASLAAVLLFLQAGFASAQTLPAAGDGEQVWVLRPNRAEKTFQVLHRSVNSPAEAYIHAGRFNGELAERGIAAADDRLWVAYSDGTFQRLTASRNGQQGRWKFTETLLPQLPDAELEDLAAADHRPWALLKGNGSGQAESGGEAAAQPSGDAASSPQESGQAGRRLVVLRNRAWEQLALPEAFPVDRPAWLVSSPGETRPRLLAAGANEQDLLAFRWHEDGWQQETYAVSVSGGLSAGLVQEQLVVGRPARQGAPVKVELALLRGGETSGMGSVQLAETEAGADWRLVPTPNAVGIMADRPVRDGEAVTEQPENEDDWPFGFSGGSAQPTGPLELAWVAVDLRGGVVEPVTQLEQVPPAALSRAPQSVVALSLLVLVLVLGFSFFRRDAVAAGASLPAGLEVADLLRRAIAGALDLAPAMVVALAAFNLSPGELFRHWPGQQTAADWQEMLPGVLAIAVFLGHTLLAEVIWGRSLGKAMTGLKVISLDGSRPRFWQILVRGLMKGLDLIVFLLLILPAISAQRQRLGDVVARTVVASEEDEEETEQTGGN